MRKSLFLWGGALGLAVVLSSCVTDPYYTSGGGSYGSSYSGYGDGYGYGSSGFSTSLFVSTGNPRWGYDPSCYSYYDYNRRCYYDPYLYGYYPVGYRPPVIIGCPHPYGWRPGKGYCPPPSRIRDVTVVNYRNRESSYRNLNHSWSRNVRADYGNRSNHGPFNGQSSNRGPSGGWNQKGAVPYKVEKNPPGNSHRGGFGNSSNKYEGSGFRTGNQNATLPRGYNQPVITQPPQRIKDTGFRNNTSGYRTQPGELRGLGQSNPGFQSQTRKTPTFGTGRSGNSQPNISPPREAPRNFSNPQVRQSPPKNERSSSDGDQECSAC